MREYITFCKNPFRVRWVFWWDWICSRHHPRENPKGIWKNTGSCPCLLGFGLPLKIVDCCRRGCSPNREGEPRKSLSVWWSLFSLILGDSFLFPLLIHWSEIGWCMDDLFVFYLRSPMLFVIWSDLCFRIFEDWFIYLLCFLSVGDWGIIVVNPVPLDNWSNICAGIYCQSGTLSCRCSELVIHLFYVCFVRRVQHWADKIPK